MKIFKYLGLGLGLIILLSVIGVGIFLATFDANQYKQDLSALVQQQTGRNLEFQGDIGLTLYPALGMKLGSLEFSNAAGFAENTMMSVQQASVSVDVLSLFSLNPQIDQLVLDGLTLNLQKNKQGVTNWDDLVKQSQATTEKSAAGESAKESDSSEGLMALSGRFGGLNITNANLVWKDDMAGVEYRVQDLTLTSGEIQQGVSFPLALKFALNSPGQLQSNIELTSNVLLQEQQLMVSGLNLNTKASGQIIPVDTLDAQISGDVSYVFSNQQLALKGFSSTINSSGGVLQQTQVGLSGEIGFDLDKQQLTIAALDLQANLKDPALPRGEIQTGLSASELRLRIPANAVELKDLNLALNENRFSGFVKVADYTQPELEFALSAPSFDVDKLLGEAEAGPKPEAGAEPQAPAQDVQIALPMKLLRDLKMNGKLEVGKLLAQKLTFTNVVLEVSAANGVIDLKPVKLDLYDGQFNGSVQVNAQGKQPVYTVNKKLSSFQIGKFLQDFMGDDRVSGDANLEVNLKTQGEWLSQLKSNLDGDMNILIKDGALKGFNLRQRVESAKARLKGKQPPEQEQRKTDFSALSLSGVIQQGVFRSDDLNLQAPLIRVGGKGSADLAKETVDYLVNAKLVGTSKGQDGAEADDLAGLDIPVAIRGPWLKPEIDVQLDEMLKARLEADKARIRDEVAKQKAAVQKQLAEQKAKLKAAQAKKLEAEKAKLENQKKLAEAEKKAELEARKEAEKEKAKKKLEEKLQKLF